MGARTKAAKRELEIELPDGQRILYLTREQANLSLTRLLRQQDVPLNTRCGEKDMCAGCVIELVDGSLESCKDARTCAARNGPIEVRACQYRLGQEPSARLRIPQRALLVYPPQVVDSYRINITAGKDPLVSQGLGVAADIGTTTVVVQIVDCATGEVLSTASGFNRQIHFGDDVLTRINLCSIDSSMVRRLQKAIVQETIAPLIGEALHRLGTDSSEIRAIVMSGNATMLHLAFGENPASMGVAPFTARFLEKPPFAAEEIGLEPPDAEVHFLPSAAAYVGADLMAGALASGLYYDVGPSLLVDVGTNGEILLKHGKALSGCATAAGPAFEGSGLACGIRAGEGAISHIRLGREIEFDLIGSRRHKATGICGSAFVDFLAEGRRHGYLNMFGRFDSSRLDGLLTDYPGHGRALKVANGQGKRPIFICEADLGRLLQAKAAIAAGILTLLERFGLRPRDVKKLYLAGGFGLHLDLRNAIACGLLSGFSESQIELVGNTSLGGAVLGLLDRGLLREMAKCRSGLDVIELNLEPSFEGTYIDQLRLP